MTQQIRIGMRVQVITKFVGGADVNGIERERVFGNFSGRSLGINVQWRKYLARSAILTCLLHCPEIQDRGKPQINRPLGCSRTLNALVRWSLVLNGAGE